jgi:dipeptidyl aminopeptidase/acylaminoacyl peptidase
VDVEITAHDHVRLKAWWLRPASPNGNCVIVMHGIADSRSGSAGFAPMFLAQGYPVLVPDSRAHGESGGEFVTYGLLEKYDAIAWTRWMRSHGCRKIYGLGESLGAAILIQAAAVEPVFAAIAAECSYADLREIAGYRLRQMVHLPPLIAVPIATLVLNSGMLYARFVDRLDFRQVSPVRSIARASTPILLIHGLDDVRTPPSQSRELAAANPRDPLWLVPGAGHTAASATMPDEFRARVSHWFAAH